MNQIKKRITEKLICIKTFSSGEYVKIFKVVCHQIFRIDFLKLDSC